MLTVHGHARGRSGRRYRPTSFDCECVCVDDGYVASRFIVVVNGALTIGDGLFWPTTHVDDFHYSFLNRIYNGGILAVAVKGKDKLGRGIVDNGVHVRARGVFDFARDLQGLKIEHLHTGSIAISDKSFPKLRKHDDTMALFQAGNGAHYGEVIGVEHFDLGAMR